MSTDTRLMVDAIRIDGGTQPRVSISEVTVAEYAETMRENPDAFPPVVVFFDGVDYWLADGFHRVHAARRSKLAGITATIHKGTKRDAVLYSVGVNGAHGLQRTNADKRKAASTLLSDSEWRTWSDREIARRCAVGYDLVGVVRRSLTVSDSEPTPRVFVDKHGTETAMNVGKIGRSKGLNKSPKVAQQRYDRIRELASEGHNVAQIAQDLGYTIASIQQIISTKKIEVPASRSMRGVHRHDANRIVGQMALDAEHLTADVDLIDFSQLDRGRFHEWLLAFKTARKSLTAFITRLEQESKKDVEAA